MKTSVERLPEAEEMVADKACDSHKLKAMTLAETMASELLDKKNAVEEWPMDEESYRLRNLVERLIGTKN